MSFLTKLALGIGTLAVVKGLDNRLEITSYEKTCPSLPEEFDGFKIAHISDLHSENVTGLSEEIEALKPDMIAVTGDMLHDDDRSYDGVIRLFERLCRVAPLYMVSGNHDLWNTKFHHFVSEVSAFGAVLLDDKMLEIHRGGSSFALYGVKDPFGKASDTIKKSLENSFSCFSDYDGFKVLLFHRANQFPRISKRGFNLILSGHMHGGQFRICGIGGLMPPKSSLIDSKQLIFPKYTEGVYQDGDTTMIVNRGIGNPMFIPRLYNRPEIGIITLKS